ncbi:sulfate transporter family-domain-containing protein, partial [Gorgonomyces haynaldii]
LWRAQSRFSNVGQYFPIVSQLQGYTAKDFAADCQAGLTIAFILLPQAIAFSSLAGVSTIRALVSAVYPLIIYGLLGASKNLSVGPEAVSSVLVGVAVFQEINEHGGDPNEIASLLGLLVGLLCIFLCVIQAGFLDNVLSGFMLVGFITAAAVLIMVEQTPNLIGLTMHGEEKKEASTIEKISAFFHPENEFHVPTLFLGLGFLFFLIGLKQAKKMLKPRYPWVDKIPGVLVVVVLSLIISIAFDLKSQGFKTLGIFPTALIPPSLPGFDFEKVMRLLPNVIIITMSGYVESQSVTRQNNANAFPSGDRELLALGAANVFGSFFGTYVTFGSLPRSRILTNSGGKSNLAGMISGILVLGLFSLGGSILKFLPKAALAAIVFNAAIDLIEVHEIQFMTAMRAPTEIFYFLASFVLSMVFPIGDAILFCLALGIFFILKGATNLNVSLMGYFFQENKNKEASAVFVDLQENLEAKILDDALVMALKGPLCFYNAGQLRRKIDMLLQVEMELKDGDMKVPDGDSLYSRMFIVSETDDPYFIVLDLSGCTAMDVSGVFTLYEIAHLFHERGTRFVISGVKEKHMPLLVKAGVTSLLGNYVAANIKEAVLLGKRRIVPERRGSIRKSAGSVV